MPEVDCGCEKGLVCAVEELLLLACFFGGRLHAYRKDCYRSMLYF